MLWCNVFLRAPTKVVLWSLSAATHQKLSLESIVATLMKFFVTAGSKIIGVI